MGHNQSISNIKKKSNIKKCKLSNDINMETQGPKRFPLKLRLNQPSLSSEASLSPRFSASISSIESSQNYDGNCVTIKDMMVDILNNTKTDSNSNTNSNFNPKSNLNQALTHADHEKLFIAFHQKQQQKLNDMTLYNSAIQHRVAFVSIVGLYQSFRRVPTHILFSSLFILKLKSEWLYEPQEHINDEHNMLHTLGYDEDEEFLMLLKWKHSQGLMFFMHSNDTNHSERTDHNQRTHDNDHELPIDFGIESDHDDAINEFVPPLRLQRNQEHYSLRILPENNTQRIHYNIEAIWHDLSLELTQIYDPFCGTNYSPLVLDTDWWFNEFNEFEQSQYGASSKDIMQELNECHMKYRCVMEILFQSNPSLIPCKTYTDLENVSPTAHSKRRPKKIELSEINAISDTMSAVDSPDLMESYSPMDYFDIELSHCFEIFDTE